MMLRSMKILSGTLIMVCIILGAYGLTEPLFAMAADLNAPGYAPASAGHWLSFNAGIPMANNTNDLLTADVAFVAPGMGENLAQTQGTSSKASSLPTLSRVNSTINRSIALGNDTSGVKMPTRRPRVDPKSSKEQIQGMSDMQRIYRNAFIGSTMYKAYEGPTQYPESIDPYDNGHGVFNQINMDTIMKNALAMTSPDKHITPVFWRL